MYTEQDLTQIREQIKRRLLLLAIPAVLLLAGIVVSLVFRVQALTIVLTILLGGMAIFCYGLLIAPLRAYERHLDDVLHGITRTLTGAFKEMESQTVDREGVRYYPFLVNIGDMTDEGDDRLFYYDANLPLPGWKPGEMITVTAHDKALGAWQRA